MLLVVPFVFKAGLSDDTEAAASLANGNCFEFFKIPLELVTPLSSLLTKINYFNFFKKEKKSYSMDFDLMLLFLV